MPLTTYVSEKPNNFRTQFGADIVRNKYSLVPDETWLQRVTTVVDTVCGTNGGTEHPLMSREDRRDLVQFMHQFMFVPGGRYLYYAGRGVAFYNNCFLYKAEEDTREEWGRLLHSASDALMSGGGIGINYDVLRARGALLKRTGGTASGPLPLALSVDSHGAHVMQGGSRRSAIYGSLNWLHPDAREWLEIKDWANMKIPGTGVTYAEAKSNNFDAYAPLQFTNISLNYDDAWLEQIAGGMEWSTETGHTDLEEAASDPKVWDAIVKAGNFPETFMENVRYAMRTGEPGMSFNFFDKIDEVLRNACTEVTSEDDSDMCNIGSLNMAAFDDVATWARGIELGVKFLVCGTIRGQLPDAKTKRVREKNRRIGLGLMGMHEWLLKRGHKYSFNEELHKWMRLYQSVSIGAANEHCDRFFINRPIAVRAIAPTGTIGAVAGTTTGVEPIFSVAIKRRYLEGNRESGVETRRFQYVIDSMAQQLIDEGVPVGSIETATDLGKDPHRRLEFQADLQGYVDQGISSTLNLPAWGTEHNNDSLVDGFASAIAKYAPRLRGITTYPDGSRGGQPLVAVPYEEAMEVGVGAIFEENSDKACKSTVCGI